MSEGKVVLVGAGPGAPDLITLRGVEALRRADVVLYDRLTHPALLEHAPGDAERIYCGRAPGAPGDDRQESIHDLMVRHARAGRVVVRLKGGDPFVFGRGGEEMLALAEAGVAFEVVPGVTSSIGVPGTAGIPVTHRGISAAFAVFAAHEADDAAGPAVDWHVAARIPTAVFLMGVERLPIIVARLTAHGRRVDTPIAVIERGTLDGQRVTIGTLGNILARTKDVRPPATIVVGDVVSVRESVLALQSGEPAWQVAAALAPREVEPTRAASATRRRA
ncbi:Uroporphyrinogen-III C-methyltransferase [Luteitalea pratensis]|uniref:uroporphyrinogen-III C-methyltransferase n=1 Tax=Luteitalea pratensis TaxID=1855912 RepID=A0A143PKI4_LUTPR|nr:uroporphyrinogen-III C-methyltransferase [Luteitalea pratensis]AMY08936.1 Uroporphyrinogen-III C-methyltransferase [Luteitalea pratensis]